jgi:predicted LPLAT superfamily acyltransferase
MNAEPQLPRNPGPSWGFGFLLWAERWWPRWFFRVALMAGTWVALAFMPGQRAYSREYLAIVLDRPPRAIDLWRHFFAFMESLVLNFRAGRGVPVACQLAPPNKEAFEQLANSNQPALFGTFHFGSSDLLGYLLATQNRRVSIIRLQVENSVDTRLLGRRFGKNVSFLWINDPANLLFDLKAAIEAGQSLALKCDRLAYSAKTEAFEFLGARRLFPFTIYYLSVLFSQSVVFCTAVATETNDGINVFSSTVFVPDPIAGREQNLESARTHFQGVLSDLEKLVRQNPYLWFNFLPLNPPVTAS